MYGSSGSWAHLGTFFAVLFCLAIFGALCLLAGIGAGLWWLLSHVISVTWIG